jgi:hypothetical protein
MWYRVGECAKGLSVLVLDSHENKSDVVHLLPWEHLLADGLFSLLKLFGLPESLFQGKNKKEMY